MTTTPGRVLPRLPHRRGLLRRPRRIPRLAAALRLALRLRLDDYKSWARGLKAASYATAPDYAQRLIRIIEESQALPARPSQRAAVYAKRFGLERNPEEWFSAQSSVDEVARTEAAVDPDNYRVTINAHEGYNVYMTNGVHYVTAKENDTYENIGRKFRISARNLRKFNDLKDKQAQPMTGEVVYIERKKKRWEGNARHHICRQGETVYAVGQSYAIRSRSIERLNKGSNPANVARRGPATADQITPEGGGRRRPPSSSKPANNDKAHTYHGNNPLASQDSRHDRPQVDPQTEGVRQYVCGLQPAERDAAGDRRRDG